MTEKRNMDPEHEASSKTAKKKAKKIHAQGSLLQPWQTGRAGSNRGKPCAKLDTPYIGTAHVQKWETPCLTASLVIQYHFSFRNMPSVKGLASGAAGPARPPSLSKPSFEVTSQS